MNTKKESRIKRANSIRSKFKNINIMRFTVYKTAKHMYAQIIDIHNSKTIVSASTVEKMIKKLVGNNTGNKKASAIVGNIIANRAIEKGIKNVSFDRSGFKYHGRIKELADSARNVGLQF